MLPVNSPFHSCLATNIIVLLNPSPRRFNCHCAMDLSFNVSGAGPLSQISAHIISYDTAVWLASGAIGWWKSRERSLSLMEALSARKTSLVSTSSFNYKTYREARKLGIVQGLAIQNGVLQRFNAGVEATAVTENSGIDCLRALTTGLLCLYSVQLTSTILADIVPYGLLNPDQEDDNFEFTGPHFASLTDWVSAVAAEEDCNNFRQHLVQTASKLCRDLTGTHDAVVSVGCLLHSIGVTCSNIQRELSEFGPQWPSCLSSASLLKYA
jgi:hypothetical protein